MTEISEKLLRRHPHVFAEQSVESVEEQTRQWEQLKQQERNQREGDSSALEGVLHNLPALTRAGKIQRKAAHVGFDWPDHSGVLDKVEEEFSELRQELNANTIEPSRVEEEFGDLLFSMVNLGRHLKIDSEGALRRATVKFEQRFRTMEQALHSEGEQLQTLTVEEMEQAWQQAKQLERGHANSD